MTRTNANEIFSKCASLIEAMVRDPIDEEGRGLVDRLRAQMLTLVPALLLDEDIIAAAHQARDLNLLEALAREHPSRYRWLHVFEPKIEKAIAEQLDMASAKLLRHVFQQGLSIHLYRIRFLSRILELDDPRLLRSLVLQQRKEDPGWPWTRGDIELPAISRSVRARCGAWLHADFGRLIETGQISLDRLGSIVEDLLGNASTDAALSGTGAWRMIAYFLARGLELRTRLPTGRVAPAIFDLIDRTSSAHGRMLNIDEEDAEHVLAGPERSWFGVGLHVARPPSEG